MPRWAAFQISNVLVRDKNTPPISDPEAVFYSFSEMENYSNLTNDIRLNWDGDLEFDPDAGDVKLSYGIEAYVQNIYHRLITQRGRLPGDSSFGWDFEYLYQINSVQREQLLPIIARSIQEVLEEDPDTLSVEDVTVSLVINKEDLTENIVINLTLRPASVGDLVQVTLVESPQT